MRINANNGTKSQVSHSLLTVLFGLRELKPRCCSEVAMD